MARPPPGRSRTACRPGSSPTWSRPDFAAFSVDDTRAQKAAKLLGNLANGLDLLSGPDDLRAEAQARLRDEGIAVLAAAGDRRCPRVSGSTSTTSTSPSTRCRTTSPATRSTWQSFARGASSEVDYLNGEIVLLARRYGVDAPLNQRLQELLGAAHLAERRTVVRRPAGVSGPPRSVLAPGCRRRSRHRGPIRDRRCSPRNHAGLVNGATMVAGAAAVGWATDHLVVPALSGEHVPARVWWVSALLILGVSAVRWCTIFVRGVATGQVQYRAQAESRRAVVRRYLELDLGWHRRRSTGQLLAHAVSDVDALWSPMQYTYFALGMVFMLAIALGELFRSDPALGLLGVVLVVLVLGLNLLYQRLLTPRTRRDRSPAPTSRRCARVGRGRPGRAQPRTGRRGDGPLRGPRRPAARRRPAHRRRQLALRPAAGAAAHRHRARGPRGGSGRVAAAT